MVDNQETIAFVHTITDVSRSCIASPLS